MPNPEQEDTMTNADTTRRHPQAAEATDLADRMRHHADRVELFADAIDAEAGPHVQPRAAAVLPLDDGTMDVLTRWTRRLRTVAERLGDDLATIAGRSCQASYWNEASIALGCGTTPGLRGDEGAMYGRRPPRVLHEWQQSRIETTYARDLVRRQPDDGAGGCRTLARSGLRVAASSARVHASSCRVMAGLLDDLASGRVWYLR